jgi:hypothetical protein
MDVGFERATAPVESTRSARHNQSVENDLGEAFTRESIPEKLAQPGGLQAPETIFTDKFDYRLDLWRAGLIVRLPPLNSSEILPNIYLRSTILRLEYGHFNGSELIA